MDSVESPRLIKQGKTMKKIMIPGGLIAFFAISSQSMAYIPSDVERFKNKTSCAKCNLSGASFSPYSRIEKNGANMDRTYFTRTRLDSYTIKQGSFKKANFVKASLNSVTFENSNFEDANFSFSRLARVHFLNSTLKNLSFNKADIGGSFSSCEIYDSDFRNSNLDDVSFPKSTLKNVNFENSTMKKADLSRTTVENVSFKNADLTSAILIGSNITEELLKEAKTYKCAMLPNGDVYTNNGVYNCKQ